MASGSEDYWTTNNRLIATLIQAIKDSISTGGTLINALDVIDGHVDGLLNVSQLTTVQADLLEKLTGIDVNLATGGDVVAALDSLDGKADGFITLADLNSGQCEMLAELLGIDASLASGSDLINALDALDGTMDGRLTLSELNTSSVKTNLDTAIARLDTSITKLTDQITKLTAIEGYTHPKSTYQAETWVIPAQQTIQFAGSWAGRLNMRIRGHIDNPQIIYIDYTTPVHDGKYQYTLSAGQIIDDTHIGNYYARVYDGQVIIYTQDSG